MSNEPVDALNEHLYGQGEAPKADFAVELFYGDGEKPLLGLAKYAADLGIEIGPFVDFEEVETDRLKLENTILRAEIRRLNGLKAADLPDLAPSMVEDMPGATETVAESARRIFNP